MRTNGNLLNTIIVLLLLIINWDNLLLSVITWRLKWICWSAAATSKEEEEWEGGGGVGGERVHLILFAKFVCPFLSNLLTTKITDD